MEGEEGVVTSINGNLPGIRHKVKPMRFLAMIKLPKPTKYPRPLTRKSPFSGLVVGRDECWGFAGPAPVPCANMFLAESASRGPRTQVGTQQLGIFFDSQSLGTGECHSQRRDAIWNAIRLSGQCQARIALNLKSWILARPNKPTNELMQATAALLDADADADACVPFCRNLPWQGSTRLIFWTRGETAAEGKWLNRRVSVFETAFVPPRARPPVRLLVRHSPQVHLKLFWDCIEGIKPRRNRHRHGLAIAGEFHIQAGWRRTQISRRAGGCWGRRLAFGPNMALPESRCALPVVGAWHLACSPTACPAAPEGSSGQHPDHD